MKKCDTYNKKGSPQREHGDLKECGKRVRSLPRSTGRESTFIEDGRMSVVL